MAPSVDKQSAKMLPNEDKPMEICAGDAEAAALFTTACYVNELCKRAARAQQSFECFRATIDTMDTDEEQLHRESYAVIDCRCHAMTQQLVVSSDNHRHHQEEDDIDDTWYSDLMLGVSQGGIAINGGADAIRQTPLSPLQLSLRRGDYATMERLLRAGANADAHDATGKTALHVAAQLSDARAVRILLERGGADPSVKTLHDGLDSLALAVRSGCTPVAELLVVAAAADVHQLVDDYDMKRQYSLLHLAVEWNHAEMSDFLLRCGVDVDRRDSYGNTCLHYASRLGRGEIARLLLRHGARVHEKSSNELTALHYAVENGHRDVFELLLEHGANLNERGLGGATLLHYAVENGDAELIDTLLHRGAQVDASNRFGKTPLHFAIAQKNWRALELLLEHGADLNSKDALGKSALHTAIECCRKEVYETLLRRGADVDARDNLSQSPLHFAAKQGCAGTVELLLRHGADANARDAALQTPLHLAVRFGHAKLLEPMLGHRVDVNARDVDGLSPLHLAALGEHSKLVYCGYPYTFFARLLQNGATARTSSNSTGETPLHTAVRKRCPIFAKHLLSRGSDVDAAESLEGKTPLRLAVDNDDVECAEQLLVHGADVAPVLLAPRRPRLSPEMSQTFAKHFAKRLAAGMRVEPRYATFASTDDEFVRQCEREVAKMKLTKIHEDLTYYDLLRGGRRCLVNLVASRQLCSVFDDHARNYGVLVAGDDGSALKKNFPIYADMLERNYHVGARYAPVLAATYDGLGRVYELPAVPTERILDFLDDDDMTNIVRALS